MGKPHLAATTGPKQGSNLDKRTQEKDASSVIHQKQCVGDHHLSGRDAQDDCTQLGGEQFRRATIVWSEQDIAALINAANLKPGAERGGLL